MNKTGFFIAVALLLAVGLTFGLYPELDLNISRQFYDEATKFFPLKSSAQAEFIRTAAMWIAWGIAAPAIIALVVKLLRPHRRIMMAGRAMAFLLITMIFAAGIITNFTFKTFWGRPRPVAVSEFNGQWAFKPWWDPRGECPINCSFISGEAATAFWTYAPAALTPPQWRPLAYAGATLFGMATGGLRIAFGGHFFSDVVIAGLVTFLVIWLVHGLIYRWPATRWSDDGVDAALTRLAWPPYAWLRRRFGRRPEAPPSRATTPADTTV